MRIDKIRLTHFGKFSNREIEFSDGLNLIEGSNEAGKSTIHAFIRGMLFGIGKGRGKAAKGDVYTHFQPWDSPGAYQGSMDFEHEGKKYRLSRVFLQQQKQASLTEIDTGRSVEMQDTGITSLIPELTPTAFDNTISCSQMKLRPGDDFGEYVRNYAASLANARDADVDVGGAVGRLDQRIKATRQQIKNLDEEHIRQELNSLYEDEKDEKYIIEDRDKEAAQKDALEAELKALEAEAKAAVADISIPSSKLEAAKGELEGAEKSLEAAKSSLISDDELQLKIAQKDQASVRYEEQAALTQRLRKKDAQTKITSAVLETVGILAALLCADRIKAGIAAGLILMVSGLITLIFALISAAELKKARKDEEKAQADLRKCEDELSTLDEQIRSAREAVSEAEKVKLEKQLKIKESESEISELKAQQENRYKARIEALKQRIGTLQNELARMEGALIQYGDIGERIDEAEKRLANVSARKKELESEAAAAELAKTEIERIAMELRSSFDRELGSFLREECSAATAGKYMSARLNAKFGIEVMGETDFVRAEDLSTGTQEQLYLALRMAVARLFFGDMRIPMLFDESFAFYDDERLESVLAALSRQGSRQIFIFTCNGQEREILDRLGVEYHLVRL